MTCCADADTLRYGIFYTAVLADDWCRDGSGDSRDGDGDDGDARDAADLFGNDGAHRDGDGLGDDGEHQGFAQVKELACRNDAEDAREATDADSGEDGKPMLFKMLNLFVKRNGKHDGDGAEEKRDVVAADFVRVVADACRAEKSDDEDVCNQQRVDQRVAEFLMDSHSAFICDEG